MIAIVLPCYNEVDGIHRFYKMLCSELAGMSDLGEFEIIAVDDGSTDGTRAALDAIADGDGRVKVVGNGRNLGQEASLLVGMEKALDRGADAVVTMDCDGQDDPSALRRMLEPVVRGDADVSFGVRMGRDRAVDGFFKRVTADVFYKLQAAMGVGAVEGCGEFRAMSAGFAESLVDSVRSGAVMRVAAGNIPAERRLVEFARMERIAGDTHWSLGDMLDLAFRMLRSR